MFSTHWTATLSPHFHYIQGLAYVRGLKIVHTFQVSQRAGYSQDLVGPANRARVQPIQRLGQDYGMGLVRRAIKSDLPGPHLGVAA